MKYFFLTLSLMMFSSQSFAQACSPGLPAAFGRFIKPLVTEFEYHGKGMLITRHTGELPDFTQLEGHYSFRRQRDYISVGSILCSQECDQSERRLKIFKGCLYIDGRRARVSRLTLTQLNFETVVDGITVNRSYIRNGRRLDVEERMVTPELTTTLTFTGQGR